MPYDVNAIRAKLKASMSGKFNDPDEFRPAKATSTTEPIKYLCYVMPPFNEGDKIKGGVAEKGMEQFFVPHANHWVADKPHACPRVASGDPCPICSFGFDLLKQLKADEKSKGDEDKKAAILKTWMPQQYYMMNLFFPNSNTNAEDLRGKVMFYNAPKTIVDICVGCTMRDGPGDPESPEAYGVFYDENNGFMLELRVLKHGKNNSYKTSQFRPAPSPFVKNQDGTPNPKALTLLLSQRHNLFSKIAAPNLADIERAFKLLSDGDDSGSDGGFDSTEEPVKTSKTVRSESTVPAGKSDPGKGTSTVTSKGSAVAKKAPVATDDDDVASALSNVVDDDTPPAKPAKASSKNAEPLAAEAPIAATKVAPAQKKAAPVAAPDTDVNKDDIEHLLGQLDDDD